jgi:hypothetical protein
MLAALEILVYYSVLPRNFLVTPVRIPDPMIYEARPDDLPADWQAHPELTAIFGGRWIEMQEFGVMSVPSSVIPAERNYI